MSAFDDYSYSADQFGGTARLFPLPNLVLFPHVMQPLHIFEPRYREMLRDALDSDRLIAMAVLAPGWETNYDGRPSVYPTACLGRVALHHRLECGSYNILLVGLRRIRLIRELPPVKSYREAVVEVCEDQCPAQHAAYTCGLQRKLRDAFFKIVPNLPQAQEQIDQLLSADISLGILTDIISYLVDIPLENKERLLSEANVHRRAEMLLQHMAAARRDPDSVSAVTLHAFPPKFSTN